MTYFLKVSHLTELSANHNHINLLIDWLVNWNLKYILTVNLIRQQ